MSKRKSQHLNRGGALLWVIVWLAGLTGITWLALNIAVPRFEQKLQTAVVNSVSAFNDSALVVAVTGRQATLIGDSSDVETQNAMVAAAGQVFGVKNVSYQLNGQDTTQSSVQLAQSETDSAANVINAASDTVTSNAELATSNLAASDDVTLPTKADNALKSIAAAESIAVAELPDKNDSDIAAKNTENLAVIATEPAELPAISLRVAGNILAVEGKLAENDDPNPLIQQAMSTFKLDVVSNGVISGDQYATADWLPTLERLVPLMNKMSEPLIEVTDLQLTLAGKVATQKQHDAIIGEALSTLGPYSLVERISVDESLVAPAEADTAAVNIAAVPDAADTATNAEAIDPAEVVTAVAKIAVADLPAKTAVLIEAPAAQVKAVNKKSDEAVAEKSTTSDAAANKTVELAESTENTEEVLRTVASTQNDNTARNTKPAKQLTVTAVEDRQPVDENNALKQTAAKSAPAKAPMPAVIDATELDIAKAAKAKLETVASADAKEMAKPSDSMAALMLAEIDDPAKATAQTKLAAPTTRTAVSRLAAFELMQNTRLSNKNKQTAWVDDKELRQELSAISSRRILFQTDRDILTGESFEVLEQIAQVLVQFPETVVTIEGHTDAAGPESENLSLSLSRATTVRDHLIDYGVSVYRLRAKGYGEAVPIANNRTSEGRATNRRIEFTF